MCRKYDTLGNLAALVNGSGRTLDLDWKATAAYALPEKITPNGNAALQKEMVYSGAFDMTQLKSPNDLQQDFAYDTSHRPTTSEMATGATVSYAYSADGRTATATVNGKFTRTTTDGLGRATKVEKGYGTLPGVVVSIVESEYAACACSPVGKLKRVSRPYAPAGTKYWTSYTYDVLGRTTRVDAPANQFTTYEYVGNTVKVTDAAGKWKTYTMDSAGNIAKVTEPKPGSGTLTLETLYSYNGVNQLTEVRMTRDASTQIRTWVYDANLKLYSETLPESGTRTFGYDSAGRLAWKKDAMNHKITFEYDTYDRLTAVKRYPVDGGAEDANQRVTMGYDTGQQNGVGRLTDVWYGYGWTENFAYTKAGLPVMKRITWPSTGAGIVSLAAEYDDEGRRTSLRYPTHYTKPGSTYVANLGRKLIYGFDAAGRLGSVNQETGGSLISAINYNAASQVTSWTRAWEGNANASETFEFNVAGQLTRQGLVSGSTLVDVEYRYPAANNDGRLWQRKNWVSGEEVTYQYDSLARLSSAATTDSAWGLSWGYDGFGNRLQQTVTKGSAPVHSVSVSGLTNRIVGQPYDSNGNMLITGLSYDVDNRLAADGTWTYRYSSTNQRIQASNATDVYAWFYGFEGEMLAVYKLEKENGDAGKTWPVLQTARERVYAMGRLIRMGTQDTVVDRGASVIRHGTENLAYYPYGEERGVASANDRAKYATYTRDASTGLDYAWNRMYKVEWGRFTSADPFAGGGVATTPGSWNRYSYAGGDPVNSLDPTGLFFCPVYGPEGNVAGYEECALMRHLDLLEPVAIPSSNSDFWDFAQGLVLQEFIAPALNEVERALTDNEDCARLVGGGGATSQGTIRDIRNTPYVVTNLGTLAPQGILVAKSPGDGTVQLNSQVWLDPNRVVRTDGTISTTYLNSWAAGFGIPPGGISVTQFQATYLLHEHGHKTSAFPDDEPSKDSLELTKMILESCFKFKGLKTPQ